MGRPARAPDLRLRGLSGVGRCLVAQTRNARPGASLSDRTAQGRPDDPLTAESVENPGVHLVILLEGRQIARRITGDLIRIDLSHFIRARLR